MATTADLAREARLARQREARATWGTDTRIRCTVADCASLLHRAGRCAAHYAPLRSLVATMAGATDDLRTSRRAFSDAMNHTTMPRARWADLATYDAAGAEPEVQALLDEATDALYAAGYYVAKGPRGGRYLARKGQ